MPSGKLPASPNAASASASAYSVQAVGAHTWPPALLYKRLDIPDHHRQLPQFTRWALPPWAFGWVGAYLTGRFSRSTDKTLEREASRALEEMQ